jgi:phosphoglycolate phosphatase-like HAD superfamily hydrolase
MKNNNKFGIHLLLLLGVTLLTLGCGNNENKQVSTLAVIAQDPLPSWNNTQQKKAIIAFVGKVTKKGSPDYVSPADRIATFDNDGTLWSEQPIYFPQAFTFDRIKILASHHPEWKNKQPFKAVLEDDYPALSGMEEHDFLQMECMVRAGLTTEEYARLVNDWLATAKHPKTGHLYKEMVFQPMLELLDYLRANGFKTFIVSGGWTDFMRPWTEQVYGIPPEQIIGSSFKTRFELRNKIPVIVLLPELDFIDDNVGKPIGINQHIGRRPIAAFGNSDGDLQMLQWTTAGSGLRFAMLVHHTDADREWAYDRKSSNGRLDKALDEAHAKGWTIVDMKNDWKIIYAYEKNK